MSFNAPLVVATREGGVDRNILLRQNLQRLEWSPPARVAWIETQHNVREYLAECVATREGGVDRNNSSMEARTAEKVATREGGVDRNG